MVKNSHQIINSFGNVGANELNYYCTIFIRLPIHIRYHQPALEGAYVNFTLKRPNLFTTNCDKSVSQKKDTSSFKLENFNLPMLINSFTFTPNIVFPCKKGVKEKYTKKMVLQRTNDFLTKSFLKDNQKDIDHSYIEAEKLCIWHKLEFEQVATRKFKIFILYDLFK